MHRRAILFSGLLLAAPLAAALPPAPGVEGAALTLRLLEPADGTDWIAGETARIAWEPGRGFDGLERIEEWEAFLSVDDGLTFPVRLTPHLDFASRSVEVAVPELISDKGRLLFRVGDERVERSIPMEVRIRIVAGPRRTAPPIRRRSLAPGEPVRPGAASVVLWAEGDRKGAGAWREREAAIPMRPALESAFRAHPLLWVLSAPPESRAALAPAVVGLAGFVSRKGAAETVSILWRYARPILLLTVRRNE